MIQAITFCDASFAQSAQLNAWTAVHIGGASAAKIYTLQDIDQNYFECHQEIFSQPRGAGYWLWKPYVILKALDKLSWGDYLMYADAGVLYCSSILPMQRQLEQDGQDIYFVAGFWESAYWTKRDAYVLMGLDMPEYHRTRDVAAGYMLIKKTPETVRFFQQWQHYMEDPRILTDQPSVCGKPELPKFREHRHDQSVLTLLAKQQGFKTYRGVDGRWGIKRFQHYFNKGNTFFGVSVQEIEQIYYTWLKEMAELPLQRRVVVNTNIHDHTGIGFWLRVIRRVLQAWWWDHTGYHWRTRTE